MDTWLRFQPKVQSLQTVMCKTIHAFAAIVVCTSIAQADKLELPTWSWHMPNLWSEKIGDPRDGITGQYILSRNLNFLGVIFYAFEHYRLKTTDRGLPVESFKKHKSDPWDDLYVRRIRYTLDQDMSIDIEMHPALSGAQPQGQRVTHGPELWFPFTPTSLRVQAWLSNGAEMTGGVRIDSERTQKIHYDTRYKVAIPESDLRNFFPKAAESKPREQAAIIFRNKILGNSGQYFVAMCVSSRELGPFTNAELRLSPDGDDPLKEMIKGRVSFSEPVYSMRIGFTAKRPYTYRTKMKKKQFERTVTFECVTTSKQVIVASKTVKINS